MDRLRRLIAQISTQLGELAMSQRVTILLCATLIAVSLIWLMQWSTAPEMVAVVQRDMTIEDLTAAEDALQAGGVSFKTVGARVLVKPIDLHNSKRLLLQAGALPEGSLFDMAAAIAEQNPFLSPEQRLFSQNYAKGNELAKIIQTTPFVQKASVLINPVSRRRLGMPSDEPSASADITLIPGKEMTSEMVDGFAKWIANAVAGLKPYNVTVRDSRTGRAHSVPHPDDALGFDYLASVKQHESYLRKKIETQLAYIPGVRVQVAVELDTAKRRTTTFKHDAPQPKTEMSKSKVSSRANRAAEPGVQPNLGQAITAGPTATGNTTEESTTQNYEPKLAEQETIEQIPLTRKNVTATVGIPRSFIAGLVTAKSPDKEKVADDDPEFIAARDEQVSQVRSSVAKMVQARQADDIDVIVFPDVQWNAESAQWAMASGSGLPMAGDSASDPMMLARTFGPAAGLTLLALISLFMMLRVVRKSSDALERHRSKSFERSQDDEDEPILTVGHGAIGQASASETMLAGREVDENTMRYQEIGEEVARLVEADPTSAAQLLQRWVQDAPS